MIVAQFALTNLAGRMRPGPDDLVAAVQFCVERLLDLTTDDWDTPVDGLNWWPRAETPWDALRWANGRISIPGYDSPGSSWLWHCAPLDEWDGRIPRWDPSGQRRADDL